jgi:hypothetical protein
MGIGTVNGRVPVPMPASGTPVLTTAVSLTPNIPDGAKKHLFKQLTSVLSKEAYRFDYINKVVLYGCKTWSLTEGKYWLRVFENRVLRRIFGPKMDEVTGEWRRIHNKKLYTLYSSPDIIRVMKSR